MNTKILMIAMSVFFLSYCSGGGGGSDDKRSGFLGEWEYAYEYFCTPPGESVDLSDSLVITQGEGSAQIVLTLENDLVLTATVYGDNAFGINPEDIDGTYYDGSGAVENDGTLTVLITAGNDDAYCTRDGSATRL